MSLWYRPQSPKILEKTVGHESTILSFGGPFRKEFSLHRFTVKQYFSSLFLVCFWCWQFEFGKDFSDSFSMASLSEHCPKPVNI